MVAASRNRWPRSVPVWGKIPPGGVDGVPAPCPAGVVVGRLVVGDAGDTVVGVVVEGVVVEGVVVEGVVAEGDVVDEGGGVVGGSCASSTKTLASAVAPEASATVYVNEPASSACTSICPSSRSTAVPPSKP